VIDDPLQIGECFFHKTLRFTKTELPLSIARRRAVARRLEAALSANGWKSTFRRPVRNHNSSISGERLVNGHHVRLQWCSRRRTRVGFTRRQVYKKAWVFVLPGVNTSVTRPSNRRAFGVVM
jgi:hypothetical protein